MQILLPLSQAEIFIFPLLTTLYFCFYPYEKPKSADRRRWAQLGMPSTLSQPANAVGDAYLQLGCKHSFTCAPYLLQSKPGFGENIIWGESNAVVYANSVLGSRTDKYADYFDICAAIVGKVPEFGVHLKVNRMPTIKIDLTEFINENIKPLIIEKGEGEISNDLDAFYPTLGYLCGNLSCGQVPLIVGMEQLSDYLTADDLKAFCAAFGTTGTAPLFHMAGVTPEAADAASIREMEDNCIGQACCVTKDDLIQAFRSLDSGSDSCQGRVDLVAFGNPHLSLTECERLTNLVANESRNNAENMTKSIESDFTKSRKKHPNVKVMATLGRHVFEEAKCKGYIQKLQDFGIQFINDTCWCMLIDPPIIPVHESAIIMTNSGKYAHYGPGLTNRQMRFGGMADCIQAARTGQWNAERVMANSETGPKWLMSRCASGQQSRGYTTWSLPKVQNETSLKYTRRLIKRTISYQATGFLRLFLRCI